MESRRTVAEEWDLAIEHSGGIGPGTINRGQFGGRTHDPVFQVLSRYTPAGSSILEAGCGSGLTSLLLGSRGYRVSLLDYSAHSLRSASNNVGQVTRWYPGLKVSSIQGDCESLPFAGGVFDVVFNNGVVEHWTDVELRRGVIAEMARVTRPAGRIIVFVPNGQHPFMGYWRRKGYHAYFGAEVVPFHYYNLSELVEDLDSCGLRPIASGGLDPFSSLNVWPRTRLRGWISAGCRRLLPQPRWFSARFGITLFIVGEHRAS